MLAEDAEVANGGEPLPKPEAPVISLLVDTQKGRTQNTTYKDVFQFVQAPLI